MAEKLETGFRRNQSMTGIDVHSIHFSVKKSGASTLENIHHTRRAQMVNRCMLRNLIPLGTPQRVVETSQVRREENERYGALLFWQDST